ncbi:MAG: hypothetical protein ACFHX7_23760 [Pseudomonadota bacterium]
MIFAILKFLLALLGFSLFFYINSVFGWSVALLVFPAFSILVLLSMFYKSLSTAATILCRVAGVIATLVFLLLMLAGTTGGSFHLSPSNEVVAALLAGTALLGLAFFLSPSSGNTGQKDG